MVFSLLARPLRALGVLLAFLYAGLAVAQAMPPSPDRLRLSPEQREQMQQQMTPEQREAFRGARNREDRQRAWQGLTPDQRHNMWQTLSPEQRELMLRRVPSDERRQMWQKMSPDEREAMRQRFLQHREQRARDGDAGRHLTPDERRRLRDQIREAQPGWKGSAKKGNDR
jgi:hypothetical protein